MQKQVHVAVDTSNFNRDKTFSGQDKVEVGNVIAFISQPDQPVQMALAVQSLPGER